MSATRPRGPEPRLIDVAVPSRPKGLVLVLHGGASRRATMAVSPTQLSVLRMIPIAAAVARRSHGRLAVQRLLNAERGWAGDFSPLRSAEWALDRARERFGAELPVCLVGHSLGGRAALLAAGAPQVRGVVALAPWVRDEDDPAGDLRDTRIAIVHGSADRVASPERSEALADRLSLRADVAWILVRRGTHSMLRRERVFDGLAADLPLWMLLGEVRGPLVARLEAGARTLEV